MKRFLIGLIMTLLLIFPVHAFAAGDNFDINAQGVISITLTAPNTKIPIQNVDFSVYRVASVSASGNKLSFTLTSEFQASGVSLDDLSNSSGLANRFEAYVTNQNITGTIITTDTDGIAVLKPCETGLYLIVPHDMPDGSAYVKAASFLVSIPYIDEEGNSWQYTADCSPKIELKPLTPTKPVEPATPDHKLPQTGMLQWPVPVLAMAGVLLFAWGWADVNLRKKHEP